MDLSSVIRDYPYLSSPAALAAADMGEKFSYPRHLQGLNEELVGMMFGVEQTRRLICNIPYQHGKSLLSSIYFPAWCLLWDPSMRIVVVGNEERFATNEFGEPVREIIKRWGGKHGVKLRTDTKAKGYWKVEGTEGGLVCKGPKGGVLGRPADLFIIDDLIKTPDEALSFVIMDSHWKWYTSVVLGRMRAHTKLAIVNTRWSRRDMCGRIIATSRQTGEDWKVVKYKAIAGQNDPLGRQPGEPLWPEQVPLKQLLIDKHLSPFWDAAWQQEPRDEEGGHFSPGLWPRYGSVEGGWTFPVNGVQRKVRREDVFVLISVDWAASAKKRSDYTCIGVYGITPYNNILVLEIINERWPLEKSVPMLALACEKWRPGLVVVESTGFQTAMAIECRKHRQIPEPRQLSPHGSTKLQRAYHAITLGQGGRIYLPRNDERAKWLEIFEEQLIDFTGDDDDHDDIVDSLAYMATQCQYLMPSQNYVPQGPIALGPGYGIEVF